MCPICNQGGGSRTPATDVVCPMYLREPQIRALQQLVDSGAESRPIVLCEYAHSMGNSTGERGRPGPTYLCGDALTVSPNTHTRLCATAANAPTH